jgi:hypothetical protein
MSEVVSVRLSDQVARRLRERAADGDEAVSGLAQRLVDEGLRMERQGLPAPRYAVARSGRGALGFGLTTNQSFPRHHDRFIGALTRAFRTLLAAHPEATAVSAIYWPDGWGNLETHGDVSTRELVQRLDIEEHAGRHGPW